MNEHKPVETRWLLALILSIIPFVGAVELLTLNKQHRGKISFILAVLAVVFAVVLLVMIILAIVYRSASDNPLLMWLYSSERNTLRRFVLLFAWILPVIGVVIQRLENQQEKAEN